MRISDWSSDVCSSDLPFSAERLRKVKPFSAERLRKVKPCSAERLKDVKPCSAERLRKVKPCSAAFPSCRTRSGIQRAANSPVAALAGRRSEEHTSELPSLMRISYAVFCLKKKKTPKTYNIVTRNTA